MILLRASISAKLGRHRGSVRQGYQSGQEHLYLVGSKQERIAVGNTFRKPDFRARDVELRYENGVVCIYGTAEGLRRVAAFCQELIGDPAKGHMHREDYPVLTAESEIGAIAIFAKEGEKEDRSH
jgi:hypothetical protein